MPCMLRLLIVSIKPKVQSKTYSLRSIPGGIWQKLRIRAMREGITVNDLFLRWIQQYADGKSIMEREK